jgi:hypothetical protein
VTWHDPATLLRHRAPALLVDRILSRDADGLVCTGAERDWDWPALLEGCAQTAGLLAGMLPGGPGNTALIAEYRDVDVRATSYDGPVRFEARFDRRILRFWRHAVVARTTDGILLLSGLVALAAVDEPR